MGLRFRRRGSDVEVSIGADEVALLSGLLRDLDTLLGGLDPLDAGADGGEQDPLAAMLGIGTATAAPEDPALARLFPDGYTGDDQAASDFRRYTQSGLRDLRRTRVETVLGTLAPGRTLLREGQDQAWLGALNDLRLVLGERLEVSEDLAGQVEALAEDDPRRAALGVYDWLGWVQESLVAKLVP